MGPVDTVEWGRRQAARAPEWSEAKWRRVARVFGVELLHDSQDQADEPEDNQQQTRYGEAA
jgi:hypothetical protein